MSFQEITQFERKLFSKGIKYIAGIDEVGRGPLAGPFVVSAVILNLEKILNPDFQKILETTKSGEVTTEKIEEEKTTSHKKGDKKGRKSEKEQKEDPIENLIINDVLYGRQTIPREHLYSRIKDSKKVSFKNRSILADFIKQEAISYSIEIFEPKEVDKLGISELTQRAFYGALQKLETKPQYVLTDTFEVVKLTKEHQLNIVHGDDRSITIASASIIAKVFRDTIMIEMHEKYPNYGFDRHKGYGTKYHIEALWEHGPCEIHRKSFEPVKMLLKTMEQKGKLCAGSTD